MTDDSRLSVDKSAPACTIFVNDDDDEDDNITQENQRWLYFAFPDIAGRRTNYGTDAPANAKSDAKANSNADANAYAASACLSANQLQFGYRVRALSRF